MFSAHSCKKNWEKQARARRGRPAPPGGGCWPRPRRPGARPYLPSPGLLQRPARYWPHFPPRRRRERYEAARRGRLPLHPFSFPLPACKSHHSLSPEPSGAAAERAREKHPAKTRGEKNSEGKDLARKRGLEKTCRERASGKENPRGKRARKKI